MTRGPIEIFRFLPDLLSKNEGRSRPLERPVGAASGRTVEANIVCPGPAEGGPEYPPFETASPAPPQGERREMPIRAGGAA